MDPPIITRWSATDKLLNPRGHAARRKHVRFSIACALLSGRRGRARGGGYWGFQSRIQPGQPVKLCAIPSSNCLGFTSRVISR